MNVSSPEYAGQNKIFVGSPEQAPLKGQANTWERHSSSQAEMVTLAVATTGSECGSGGVADTDSSNGADDADNPAILQFVSYV